MPSQTPIDSQPACPMNQLKNFELQDLGAAGLSETLGDAVQRGLTATPKELPCHLIYDERGSRLFDEITRQPEYYPMRADEQILHDHALDIVREMGSPLELVELGSGSSTKTAPIIDAILGTQDELVYRPIDVSSAALEWGSEGLLEGRPALHAHAICGDYDRALAQLGPAGGHRLVLWLGGSVGNMPRQAAADFLSRTRNVLSSGDALLVGIDLRKDARVLEAAYDDAAGVSAQFSLNLLHRMRDELGARLDLDGFAYHSSYDEEAGVVRMFIESLRQQVVHFDALGMDVAFSAGERIHTEDSTKYSVQEIDTLAQTAGLTREHSWFDAERRFSESLLRVP